MILPPLPRAASILRQVNLIRNSHCIRKNGEVRCTYGRTFHNSTISCKLDSPRPPDITNAKGVDLNELTGPPGWSLNDLLPNHQHDTSPSETDDKSITPHTLHHLLHLSGLPPPRSSVEESKLLSALRDQFHFVKHVQTVPTQNIAPLIRIGDECAPGCTVPNCPGTNTGEIAFEECVDKTQDELWKEWDVCGLNGGSREGREQGWFIADNGPKVVLEEDGDGESVG